MEKFLSFSLIIILTFAFTACSSSRVTFDDNTPVPQQPTHNENPSPSPSDAVGTANADEPLNELESNNILIAYFSHTGNTEAMPCMIAEVTGAPTFQVTSILKEYEFSKNMIIPFCTHGGSGLNRSDSDIENLCPDTALLTAFEVRGSDVENTKTDMEQWLK